jgi:hypothetical protein
MMQRTSMRDGTRQATAILKIRGMSEAGRAERLRRSAAELDGVLMVDVNYILDNVTIGYDPEKLTFEQIKRKLEPQSAVQVARPHKRSDR